MVESSELRVENALDTGLSTLNLTMNEFRSCGVLIVRGDPIAEFLLMQHAGRWDLPKGHVDEGESDLECALRELFEETSIREQDIAIDPAFRFEHVYPVRTRAVTRRW
jgi:bis(5'-nucleosidyl)-tetraphosphatase